MSHWLITRWLDIQAVYEDEPRFVKKSSLSSTECKHRVSPEDLFSRHKSLRDHYPDNAKWYNRLYIPEDPWISIEYFYSQIFYGPYSWRLLLHRDHPNLVLYGEFNNSENTDLVSTRGGANVYIRNFNLCRTPWIVVESNISFNFLFYFCSTHPLDL